VALVTKKRGTGTEDETRTKTRTSASGGGGSGRAPKRTAASSGGARPRLRASHSSTPLAVEGPDDDDAPAGGGERGDAAPKPAKRRAPARGASSSVRAAADKPKRTTRPKDGGRASRAGSPTRGGDEARPRRKPAGSSGAGAGPSLPGAAGPLRKTPLTGPKRKEGRRAAPAPAPPEPSSYARELAVALATEGIEKKALGIEILDVTGKIDYADFLVIMTGRSDRHVQSIASGLEEAMRKKKIAPLSLEGLAQATWVLIDFGDVVVHVFQEDARRVYDIEGLWIDAGRVPVPSGAEPPGDRASPQFE
jgi:ribosome-associated protein